MKKAGSFTVLAAILIGAATAVILSLTSSASGQPQVLPSTSAVTLLITVGLNAKSLETWDGSISGADILSLEGRHFSEKDAITGPTSWKCTTRRDQVPPYADVHYTEIRPGSRPEVLFFPVGLYVTIQPTPGTRLSVETAQGKFVFNLSDIGQAPVNFLDNRASVARVPAVQKLTTVEFEDDEPAITTLSNGDLAVAWVAYRERASRVLLRVLHNGSWSAAEEVTSEPGDIFRCALASDQSGTLWAFWSQREDDRWQIWARSRHSGTWGKPARLSTGGSNSFPRAAASPDGRLFVVWQSLRGFQSDIYLKTYSGGSWSDEIRVSDSPANDWEPNVAAGSAGKAYIVWDSYDQSNYDVFLRSYQDGALAPPQSITSSPKFQAHASVAVDARDRPWVAWDESGVNWGKDQGFLIPTPLSAPLHQQRSLRITMWDGRQWQEPLPKIADSLPPEMRQNSEHPQLIFDGNGSPSVVFRHWTRQQSRSIGSPMAWENYVTRLDGAGWHLPRPITHSAGSIEKLPALSRASDGSIRAAWMTDSRPFHSMIPQNAEIYTATVSQSDSSASAFAGNFAPFAEPFLEAIPVHPAEAENVKAIRDYTIEAGGRKYKIYRGDMHRHTDVSQDFKYDGSLLEVYRYARDAATFDYIAPTDHQSGFDQEFTWWQNQQLVDLFLSPGAFVPLFAYERSVRYPNGHRNVVFAHRGVRTLPVPEDELAGRTGAAKLYEYLRQNRGISMPHSSATDQGTDWRDNDTEVEPLIEIFQGYRNSYEYEGAPRSATALNQQAQKSGWQPAGFWWNALAKGYKLGVQASSDHWSTHISYACLVADSFTRDGLLDAIRRRHSYAATDNIILDFRARVGDTTYLMGDIIRAKSAPQLLIRTEGTGAIQQIDIIKNQRFVHTARPATKNAQFEFQDKEFEAGKNYYYVRVLQENGQLAWSSPIWVE